MNITICGGGNLGHVCAGFLASQDGNRVSLLTTKPDSWSHQIDVVDCNGKVFHGKLELISNDPADVIPGADMVLVCLPGFAIRDVLEAIAPHLAPICWVGTVVSSTGFFFEAFKALPQGQPLFGFQRVPFISRTSCYGKKAELKGYKKCLDIAVEQADDKETLRRKLEQLFQTPVRLLGSHFEVSLSNSNPLLHTSRIYTMWKDWKPGVSYEHNPAFYSEWTLEASELYIAMDKEFQQLLKKLKLKEGAVPPVLEYYECKDAESLTRKFHSIPAFKGILSPMAEDENGKFIPDFSSRYFQEDFHYGLSYIVKVAAENNAVAPTINKVYNWGLDFMKHIHEY